jgi:hypothetical protein
LNLGHIFREKSVSYEPEIWHSLQREANLIKQKHMTQKKTAAHNIKNQPKSSTENEKTEELEETNAWAILP